MQGGGAKVVDDAAAATKTTVESTISTESDSHANGEATGMGMAIKLNMSIGLGLKGKAKSNSKSFNASVDEDSGSRARELIPIDYSEEEIRLSREVVSTASLTPPALASLNSQLTGSSVSASQQPSTDSASLDTKKRDKEIIDSIPTVSSEVFRYDMMSSGVWKAVDAHGKNCSVRMNQEAIIALHYSTAYLS